MQAHASIAERMRFLMEKFCGDSAGKHEGHAKELEALKGPHASTTERLN